MVKDEAEAEEELMSSWGQVRVAIPTTVQDPTYKHDTYGRWDVDGNVDGNVVVDVAIDV